MQTRLLIFYMSLSKPLHMNSASSNHDFKNPYPGYFGGVTSIKTEQYKQMNGFSNIYFGWGGEDDDFRQRIESATGQEGEQLDRRLGR